jgi:3-oxoacyl-[acyl-carrier protein] reductase
MDLGIDGKVAVVTGASKGIGLQTARRLVDAGASVLLIARTETPLAAAAKQISASWLAADVTDAKCAARILAQVRAECGEIDILVNNAGTTDSKPLEELSEADWQLQYELNVLAPMRLMRAAAPIMEAKRWGRIVNVASSSGKRPSLRNVAYSVTKAAELSLSRAFADTYAGTGVLVNSVSPGVTATELWTGNGGLADQEAGTSGSSREAVLAQTAAKLPLRRLGDAGEVADVIAFLCSERAAGVNGAAWSADGGTFQSII